MLQQLYFQQYPPILIDFVCTEVGSADCFRLFTWSPVAYSVFLLNVFFNHKQITVILFPATRESAFVHAIASAGVAFAVTRACADGSATICGCDTRHKGPPGEGWKWGGCSEDAEFGSMVSREFADARENRPDARSAMNRHNNEAGRMVE